MPCTHIMASTSAIFNPHVAWAEEDSHDGATDSYLHQHQRWTALRSFRHGRGCGPHFGAKGEERMPECRRQSACPLAPQSVLLRTAAVT
jgi:hypothetical protein